MSSRTFLGKEEAQAQGRKLHRTEGWDA